MRRWLRVIVVVAGVGLLLLTCLPTVRVTEGWTASCNTVRLVGLGLQTYHEVHGQLPPAVVRDPAGRPLYSWRVLLLPYAEHQVLYDRFRLDEPWDSPHNLPLSREVPRCYTPYGGWNDDPGTTRVQVVTGPGTAFELTGLSWTDFPDGLGNTALVVEAGDPVPWSSPGDVVYDPAGPLPRLGAGRTKPVKFLGFEISRHPGFAVCLADGTSRFVRSSTDEAQLRALLTRNGGEAFDASRLP